MNVGQLRLVSQHVARQRFWRTQPKSLGGSVPFRRRTISVRSGGRPSNE